jgi:nucleoid-associated protein YgaU
MAFAMGSMLPFAGCSSQQQQQQATDEVAAEGQQGEGDEEQGGQQEASADGQAGAETAAEETVDGAPVNGANDATGGGENVASNNATTSAQGSADGEIQEIITEMNGSSQNQAAAGATPADEATAAPEAATAEAAPADEATAAPEATPTASPEAAPAVAGIPEQGSKMAYVVEAGDTLAKIAMKIFGDPKRWKEMANLSGMDNPNHIYPGDIVYYSLDDSSKNFASAYESIQRAKEVVREGDTLAAISQRVYGTSKAWRQIWRQNDKIDNPDILSAGMTIYYVEKGAVKTALNKLKGQDFAKVLKGSKTSAEKVVKPVKVMSKVGTIVPTTAV